MVNSKCLPSAYLPPVQYFVHLVQASQVRIECFDNYSKQTYRNRCLIATQGGVQSLTVPIVKPEGGKQLMRDIRISDHGNWRHLHWNALKTAYNSSPFFECYADDFAPFYEKRYPFLFDFNMQLLHLTCSLIDIDTPITPTTSYQHVDEGEIDLRQLIQPRTPISEDSLFVPRPYYQVFQSTNGFLPNLSIVDLLFNMGPEAIIELKGWS